MSKLGVQSGMAVKTIRTEEVSSLLKKNNLTPLHQNDKDGITEMRPGIFSTQRKDDGQIVILEAQADKMVLVRSTDEANLLKPDETKQKSLLSTFVPRFLRKK